MAGVAGLTSLAGEPGVTEHALSLPGVGWARELDHQSAAVGAAAKYLKATVGVTADAAWRAAAVAHAVATRVAVDRVPVSAAPFATFAVAHHDPLLALARQQAGRRLARAHVLLRAGVSWFRSHWSGHAAGEAEAECEHEAKAGDA